MIGSTFTLPPKGFRMPFDVEASLVSLPAYAANAHVASLLDPLVNVLREGGYHIIFRASPSTQQPGAATMGNSNLFAPMATFEDQISVPTGSYLMMIGGFALDTTGANATNRRFRVQFYDAGAQSYVSDSFVNGDGTAGHYEQIPRTGTGLATEVLLAEGLFILPSPLSITSPGQLNVQITNLEAINVTIDMTFIFAAPNGRGGDASAARLHNTVRR